MSDGAPSWVNPPNFLEAIRAGASTGLSLRQQDTQERDTADRLRLAYDQLQSQERRAAQAAQMKLELQQQNLGMKAQQLASQDQYRQSLAEVAKGRLAETTAHNTAMEEISADRAKSLVDKGQAQFFTDPMAPGQVFLRQNTGHVTKVSGPPAESRVTLGPEGSLKSFTGRVSDPLVQQFMGTNAPPALQPKPFFNVVPGTPSDELKSQPDNADEMVSVINPSGKRVKIRKAQLQDALGQGYTQP